MICMSGESTAAVCEVGDRIRVADWPAVEGGFVLVQGEVIRVRRSSRKGYRYELLCDDEEKRSTRLKRRLWSILRAPRLHRTAAVTVLPSHQFILAPMVHHQLALERFSSADVP